MARSFLSSRDPAFAAQISSAYERGAQTGAEFGMRTMAEDAASKRADLEYEHQTQLHKATQDAENSRFLLGKQVEGVKETAKTFRDQADKIDSDLQSNGRNYSNQQLKLLKNQSFSLRAAAQNADATIGRTFGYNVPSVSLTPPDPNATREQIYTPEVIAEDKDKASKAAADASNASMQNFSNKIAFANSGGAYATPSEATTAKNTASESSLRTIRGNRILGYGAGKNKLVGDNGEPLSAREQFSYESSQVSLPSMWHEYNNLVGAANSRGVPSSSGNGTVPDPKFQQQAQKKLSDIGKNYGFVAGTFLNNSDNTIRSAVGKLGLGLREDSALDDYRKVTNALSGIGQNDPNYPVYAHIYQNLGFGAVPSAPKYTPQQSTVPQGGGLFDQGY